MLLLPYLIWSSTGTHDELGTTILYMLQWLLSLGAVIAAGKGQKHNSNMVFRDTTRHCKDGVTMLTVGKPLLGTE